MPIASSSAGNPASTISAVTIAVQVNTGRRSSVTCGARIRSAVHKVVALIKIMPLAARNTPAVHSEAIR